MNFTNSKLLANHIYLWYNNTNKNKNKKQNIVNSLVRWKHTLLDFCFQKIRKENMMVEIITKTISIIYNIMKLLVRLYIKSFEYYPKTTTFCTIYTIVRYLFFP
ncbi:hypothetical protein HMPREF3228_01032 [Streptococcus mitis]|uniref:Uncharacterized protein n=1 Tax=Streptococcus mitis TaxID=28037 RepID=A0A133RYW9_STRMT|nr:hypothetical protein HMPREF3228_01032 [Streptococcus mitis]